MTKQDMVTEMAVITERVNTMIDQNSKEHNDILKALEKLDKKKAGKWTEPVVMGMLLALIGAVIKIIIIGM
jgi:uncharacterized coiled-coil DUF342 family protein